jgi:hypothetical protein
VSVGAATTAPDIAMARGPTKKVSMALAGWAVTSENSRVIADDRTIAQLFRIMILSLKKFKKAAADPQPTRHLLRDHNSSVGGVAISPGQSRLI